MSLTLTNNPVETIDDVVYNLFPGYSPINLGFKREDIAITSVSQESQQPKITIESVDLTSDISAGDNIYFYALTDNFEYDGIYTVDSIVLNGSDTEIILDTVFIEPSTDGYINYLSNYYVEVQVIDLQGRDLLDFNLISDGKPNGQVDFDLNILNDRNTPVVNLVSGQIESERIKFKYKYRERYDGDANSFVESDDILIVYCAIDDETPETIISDFTLPKLFLGYPFWVNALHSDANEVGNAAKLTYNELSINGDIITSDNVLYQFSSNEYGILTASFLSALSASTVKKIQFALNFVSQIGDVSFSGLILYYEFTGDYDDSSGNELHGTNSGTVFTDDRNLLPNQAIEIDTSSDIVTIPNLQTAFGATTSDKVTLAFYIWFPDNGIGEGMFFGNPGKIGFVCDIQLRAVLPSTDPVLSVVTSFLPVIMEFTGVVNTWYKVLIEYEVIGSQKFGRLYVDDTLIIESSISGTDGLLVNDTQIGIGNHTGDNNAALFKIDRFLIYNRILTPAEKAMI